jgi:hypothetical protein
MIKWFAVDHPVRLLALLRTGQLTTLLAAAVLLLMVALSSNFAGRGCPPIRRAQIEKAARKDPIIKHSMACT